jgi:hypothetical protein
MFSFIIYGEKVSTLPELRRPRDLAVDDTQLYVTESATIFIYSLKDFKLVKTFGKEGQGPQEFQTLPHVPVTVDVSTDRLIVFSIRKISYFTKQGEYINEVRAVNLALNLRLCGDRFLGWSQAKTEGVTYNTINLFDSKLNKLKEVFRLKDSYQGPGRGYEVLHSVFTYRFYDNKIFLPGKDDATIDIFDSEMNKLLSLRLDQERIEVDREFKNRLIKHFKTSPEIKNIYPMLKPLIFPDYFPVISDFFVDDGKIYVMTWKRDNDCNEFSTYDMKGQFKRRLMIPIQYETDLSSYPTMVKKGKLYQLVDNEEKEEWELHISEIK